MKYQIVAAALFSSALAVPGWGPPAGYSDGGWGTSTVEVTEVVTVTSCGGAYANCGAGSTPVPASTAPASSVPAYGWSSAPAPSSYPAPVPSSYPEPVPSSAPAPSYPAGSWPAPVPSSSAAPVPSSYPAPASSGWGPAPSYPAAGTSVVYPTGTAPAYPSQSTWAPVPATGAGSTVKTGGILAAAGALFALFL